MPDTYPEDRFCRAAGAIAGAAFFGAVIGDGFGSAAWFGAGVGAIAGLVLAMLTRS